MPTIVARGAAPAPAAPAPSPAQNLALGQPDKVVTPAAPAQPQTEETEAQRLERVAREQAGQRAAQRARQERERAQQLDRQKLEQQAQTSAQELQKLQAKLARLKSDPYSVMLEEGLTADEVAALMVQQPEVSSQKITVLEDRLSQALAEIEELKGGQKKQQDQSRESARKQIRHDVSEMVKADEGLEAMRLYGDQALDAAVMLIERTYDTDGYVMDTAQAIQEIEEYLVEESAKAAALSKVKARLSPPADPAQPAQPAPGAQGATQKTQPMKTLSQAMVPSSGRLSSADRKHRAILAFQGKL